MNNHVKIWMVMLQWVLVSKSLFINQSIFIHQSIFFNQSLFVIQQAFPGMIHINGRFESSRRIPNTCNVSIIGQEFKGFEFFSQFFRFQSFISFGIDNDVVEAFTINFLSHGWSFKAELTRMYVYSCLLHFVDSGFSGFIYPIFNYYS